jgi:hypothetical protein
MILVTGASGNVGTELARILMARHVPFRAMVRSPEAAQKIEALAGVEIVAGDFNDTATIARALAGIDRAFLTPSSEQVEAQQSAFVEVAQRVGSSTSSSCPNWQLPRTRRCGSFGSSASSRSGSSFTHSTRSLSSRHPGCRRPRRPPRARRFVDASCRDRPAPGWTPADHPAVGPPTPAPSDGHEPLQDDTEEGDVARHPSRAPMA